MLRTLSAAATGVAVAPRAAADDPAALPADFHTPAALADRSARASEARDRHLVLQPASSGSHQDHQAGRFRRPVTGRFPLANLTAN